MDLDFNKLTSGNLEWNKIINIAMMPAIALIAISLLGFIPFIGIIFAFLLWPLNLVIMGYAGYTAVKNHGLDLVTAGVVGSVAGAAATIVNFLLSFMLSFVGFGMFAGMNIFIEIITLTFVFGFAFVISLISGFVIALIGGIIAQKQ